MENSNKTVFSYISYILSILESFCSNVLQYNHGLKITSSFYNGYYGNEEKNESSDIALFNIKLCNVNGFEFHRLLHILLFEIDNLYFSNWIITNENELKLAFHHYKIENSIEMVYFILSNHTYSTNNILLDIIEYLKTENDYENEDILLEASYNTKWY